MTCPWVVSFTDQYEDLRQGTKSSLLAKLAVYITYQPVSNVEIADGNTLLYHIAWPQNGTVSIIAESMDSRLGSGTTNYHPPLALSSHKIIVWQDRYLDVSPKSHERSKRMGANTPPANELMLWTTLPTREQILRSTTNKKVFLELLKMVHRRRDWSNWRTVHDVLILSMYSVEKKKPRGNIYMTRFDLPPCLITNVPSCLDCIEYQVVIQMAISFAKVT